jgi:hypothetical protein
MASVKPSISASNFSICTNQLSPDINLARPYPFLVLQSDVLSGGLFVPWLLGSLDQFGLVALCQNLLLLQLGDLGGSVNSTLFHQHHFTFLGLERRLTYLNGDMYRDIGSDDFTTATLRNLGVGSNELASTTSFRQGHNNVLLLFEHRCNLGFLALNDNGNLVFKGLSVGRKVVKTNNRSSGSNGVVRQVKVGCCLREILLGDLSVSECVDG